MAGHDWSADLKDWGRPVWRCRKCSVTQNRSHADDAAPGPDAVVVVSRTTGEAEYVADVRGLPPAIASAWGRTCEEWLVDQVSDL